ncbi:hypothetical protein [Faecalibacter sp. LW9]|uniref:hypothetical protein n=1 Tax=Faecalibacter sp. LW9 TaxID=3103144 RepID=UPI002AFDDEB4|nr:hypothetical protein [Faecalibacter sp. LW9]
MINIINDIKDLSICQFESYKKIITSYHHLILGNPLLYGQSAAKFLVFPGCEKFESKGNQKLIDCYDNKFNQLFTEEVKKILREYHLAISNVNINAKINDEINTKGEYQNQLIKGTYAEKAILNQTFFNDVILLKKRGEENYPCKIKTWRTCFAPF